jgi:hypothetical protein
MRPDVALAFDRMAAAARFEAGLYLIVTSGYRSDAEQARPARSSMVSPAELLSRGDADPARGASLQALSAVSVGGTATFSGLSSGRSSWCFAGASRVRRTAAGYSYPSESIHALPPPRGDCFRRGAFRMRASVDTPAGCLRR